MKAFTIHLPATLTVTVNATSKAHALKMARAKEGLVVNGATGFSGTMLEGCEISVGKTEFDNVKSIDE